MKNIDVDFISNYPSIISTGETEYIRRLQGKVSSQKLFNIDEFDPATATMKDVVTLMYYHDDNYFDSDDLVTYTTGLNRERTLKVLCAMPEFAHLSCFLQVERVTCKPFHDLCTKFGVGRHAAPEYIDVSSLHPCLREGGNSVEANSELVSSIRDRYLFTMARIKHPLVAVGQLPKEWRSFRNAATAYRDIRAYLAGIDAADPLLFAAGTPLYHDDGMHKEFFVTLALPRKIQNDVGYMIRNLLHVLTTYSSISTMYVQGGNELSFTSPAKDFELSFHRSGIPMGTFLSSGSVFRVMLPGLSKHIDKIPARNIAEYDESEKMAYGGNFNR